MIKEHPESRTLDLLEQAYLRLLIHRNETQSPLLSAWMEDAKKCLQENGRKAEIPLLNILTAIRGFRSARNNVFVMEPSTGKVWACFATMADAVDYCIDMGYETECEPPISVVHASGGVMMEFPRADLKEEQKP